MSKIGLRVLVKEFLSAAAYEIVEAVEKIIADYEEEMLQSKREISRQRKMLDALLQPELKLNRIREEAQLNLSVWEEDFLTEQQQEWNSSPRQKNPESLQTERSHKEPLSSSQDRRPEDDTIHDTFTPQCEENEHEIDKVEEEPLPVPSPGFSEPENGDDDDWNATQDGDSDRNEELEPSTLTGKKTKKKDRRPEDNTTHDTFTQCEKNEHEIDKVVVEPLPVTSAEQMITEADEEVPSPGVSVAEHGDDDEDWRPSDATTTQDKDSDRDEELTAKTPPQKKKRKAHVNKKAEVCDSCGICFSSSNALETHMRIHTGEKPYNCSECGESFSSRQKMTKHLRIHHTSLKQHMQAHSAEPRVRRVCKVCGKDLPSMVSLVNHTCGKGFRRITHVKYHMKSVSGGRPSTSVKR